MEKEMEHEMEAGAIKGCNRDPSIQRLPRLGPKVYVYYLHWAIWISGLSLRARWGGSSCLGLYGFHACLELHGFHA